MKKLFIFLAIIQVQTLMAQFTLTPEWPLDHLFPDDSKYYVSPLKKGEGIFFSGNEVSASVKRVGSGSLELNGIKYVNFGNPTNLPAGNSPRTMSAWLRTNTTSGVRTAVAYGTASNNQSMYIGQNGTTLVAGAFDNTLTVSGFWTANTWHFISLSYDGTTARLYADGVEVASATKSWNLVLSKFYFGRNVNDTEYWSGNIDQVKILNYATENYPDLAAGSTKVAEWDMENTVEANGTTSSAVNAPTFTIHSRVNHYALNLNGTNQYVNVTNSASFPSGQNERTINVWAKTNTVGSGARTIVAYGTASNNQSMFIGQSGTSLIAGAYGSGNYFTVTNFWAVNVWRHLSLTYDGQVAKLYADGILVASGSRTWSLVPSKTYIGRNVNDSEYWNGSIDGLNVFSTWMSAQQIQKIASAPGPAPSNLSVTQVTHNKINLSWTDNSSNENAFEVKRFLVSGGNNNFQVFQSGTTYSDNQVEEGTTYYYLVRAKNDAGYSNFSAEVSATTLLNPPSNLQVMATTSSGVYLAWKDNSLKESGYRIERSTTSGSGYSTVGTVGVNVQTFTDNTCSATTTYYYRVAAIYPSGQLSHYSNEKSALTLTTAKDADQNNVMQNFAFVYQYDDKGRMTTKKVPGADPVYMVYDNRDRLVLTQDGNQRITGNNTQYWTFTKYDEFNRPILTGIKDTTTSTALTQADMQAVVDSYYELKNTTKPWRTFGEQYDVGNPVHGYSNTSYPQVTTGGVLDVNKYLSVTYYDRYTFRNSWVGDYGYQTDDLISTDEIYQQPDTGHENTQVLGLITGTKVKVLDGGTTGGYTWLKSVNYYDDKYRLIQNKSDNYKGGVDKVSNLYDFVGKVLKTKSTHTENDVTWKNVVGLKQEGNKLIGAGATGWGNMGASSVQVLPAGADGWMEVTMSETDLSRMVGFSDVDSDQDQNSIDFAFYQQAMNYYVRENGVWKATIYAPSDPNYTTNEIKPGDVVRIERNAGVVKFYWNGQLIYTSPTASTSQLMVDASFYNIGSTLVNVRTSFGLTTKTITRTFQYDHAGRLINTFHQLENDIQNVTWTNVVDATVTGNEIIKTGATVGWTAGGFSVQSIPAGKDGYLEFPAKEINKTRMIGLSDQDVNVNYTTIDYCFYLNGTSVVVRENGTQKGTVGTYSATDIFRIERKNGVIQYFKNGNLFYTSLINFTGALFADCSLNSLSASVSGATLRTKESEILLAHNEYNELGQLIDKKLHSTLADASDNKQSVDYRYNIRGWLTSMNDASLTNTTSTTKTNDDATDYFGMNLSYNTVDTDLTNAQLYNGNISAIKWSNYGDGTVKQKGYTYSYDHMNRITGSFYKEKTTSWTAPANNGFDERGYQYDLNGNITKLTRFDKRASGFMDSLTYNYGSGTTLSNQLLSVTDGGDDFKGFIDGTNTGNDYTYDANGNMTRDLNKGIGTSLSDNTNKITYNFLNLPETVTKGGNTVRYIYDATGRKLAQAVTMGAQTRQTDYAGEFVYENDALQFINHEEGRIVTSSTKLIYVNSGEATTDFTASNATLAPVTQNGTEKYVKATSNGTVARTGVFPVGGTIPVAAGERYKIRMKGYRTGTSVANLLIKAGGNDLSWPGTAVPLNAATESWIEQIVTIPAGATTLEAGAVWATVTSGEVLYINEFEISKLETTTPEYQYNLKDHLGNVRLTFTTKQETESATATMEVSSRNAEKSKFVNYDRVRIVNTSPLFDHTNDGVGTSEGSSIRLSGDANNEKTGLIKTLSVMPGDVVNMEVYAKYLDANQGNWNAFLVGLVGSIHGTTPSGVTDGASYSTNNTYSFPYTGVNGTGSSTGTGPKAYLNFIMFDKDFNPITDITQTNYRRISTAAKETGTNLPNGVAHERLNASVTVKQPGYMYIYLSNEETGRVEVYFDDFKVDHIKSPIVQMDDYYAFGLTFNSNRRDVATINDYLFNGFEFQDELNLGWYDYLTRQYDPSLGRFMVVDPAADLMRRYSPYCYAFDNPIRFIDPDGMFPEDQVEEEEREGADGLTNEEWIEVSRPVTNSALVNKNRKQNRDQKKKDPIDDILVEHGVGQTRDEMLLPRWKDVLEGTITLIEILASPSGKSKGLTIYEKILEKLGAAGDIVEVVDQANGIYNKQVLHAYSGARLDDLSDYNTLLNDIYGKIKTQLSEVQQVYDNLPESVDKKANARNRLHYGEQIYKLSDKLDVVSREVNAVKILIHIRREEQKYQH